MGKEQSIKQLSTGRKIGIAAGIISVMFAAVILIYSLGLLKGISLKFLDFLFYFRGELKAQEDIVIVNLDSDFKKEFRETNAPVSRRYMGKLLSILSENGAFMVAFDKLFLKPDWSSDGDKAFAQEILRCQEEGTTLVIVASYFDTDKGIMKPIEVLEQLTDHGFINLSVDGDGVVRRIRPLYVLPDPEDPKMKDLYGSYAVWVAAYYEDIGPDQWKAGSFTDDFTFKIGNKTFKEDTMIINYTGGRENFTYVSAFDILHNKEDLSRFSDPVFLVADTTSESQDFYAVPYSQYSFRYRKEKEAAGITFDKTKMPGVEVHANAIQSLLNNSWIRKVSSKHVVSLLVVIAITTGFLLFLPKIPAWATVLIGIGIILSELGLAYILFTKFYWFDMIPIFLLTILNFGGGTIYKNLILDSVNRKVAGMFGQYVSPNIVEKILTDGVDISLKGKTEDVTVLFSDIRGFTSIAEKLAPEEIGILLNTYFDRMIKIVFEHDGTLDKLMGDAIMAFYGDPIQFSDHPTKACRTALTMISELKRLKEDPPVDGIEMLNIGIGVNSGPVTVGDLGSFKYRDYTVIGDNVNLGSRVEGMNKLYGTNIIVTEFTRDRVQDEFVLRKMDAARVKGKSKPVTIYELVSERGGTRDEDIERINRFEKGLDLYMKAQFTQAEEIFKDILSKHEDGPSRTFLQRCEEYLKDPPPDDWDGVYTATSK